MDLNSYAGIGGYKRLRNISNLILPDDDEIIFDELDKNHIELNNTLENEIYIDVDSNDTFTFDDNFSDGVELFNDQISEVNSNSSTDEILVEIPIEIISSDIFLGCKYIQGDTEENCNREIKNWMLEPLFDGCTFNCQHVLLILEYLKAIGHLGDGQESVFLGIICSILPDSNHFSQELSSTSGSVYFFQKMIKSGHNNLEKMRVLEIPCCQKGHTHFVGENKSFIECPVCQVPNGINNERFFYFPLRDRIKTLLYSDMKIFFDYPQVKYYNNFLELYIFNLSLYIRLDNNPVLSI
jgi:hypothetical protein